MVEFLVNPQCGTTLDISHQRGTRDGRIHTRQNVDMICHAPDAQHFAFMIGDTTCHIFEQFIFPFRLDETFPMLYGEDVMVVNLRISVCHYFWIF